MSELNNQPDQNGLKGSDLGELKQMAGQDTELLAVLKRIEASCERQERHMKTQSTVMIVIGIAAVIVGAAAIYTVSSLLPTVQGILTDAGSAVANIEEISGRLVAIDFETMLTDTTAQINGLIEESSTSIEVALEKIEAIDFERLNAAIVDLGKVVRPLANFFGGR